MADYRVQGGNCSGITMSDGTRYDADRTGRVVVDNPKHARAIEAAGHTDGGYIHKTRHGAPVGVPSKHCVPCRFVAYAWQHDCPKCGRPLTAPAKES